MAFGGHFSVQHRYFQIRKNVCGQFFIFLLYAFYVGEQQLLLKRALGFYFWLIRHINSRANDKYLPPFFHFAPDKFVCRIHLFWVNHFCDDRFSRLWHLVQKRHVKISVYGKRKSARNGCSGHRKKMRQKRARPFFYQMRSRVNAKPMLLVDNNKAEAIKRDAFLDKRMRPYDYVRINCAFFRARAIPDRYAKRSKETLKRMQMLARKNFRGRHKYRAEPRAHNQKQRRGRDNRFPGAHIAFKNTIHGRGLRQIVCKLPQRPALGVGKAERQRPDKLFYTRHVQRNLGGALFFQRHPLPKRAELDHKEILEHEPALCPARLLLRLWEMDCEEGLGKPWKVIPLKNIRRNRISNTLSKLDKI